MTEVERLRHGIVELQKLLDYLKRDVEDLHRQNEGLQQDLDTEREHSASLAEKNRHFEYSVKAFDFWGEFLTAAAGLAICTTMHHQPCLCGDREAWAEAAKKMPYSNLLAATVGKWEVEQ